MIVDDVAYCKCQGHIRNVKLLGGVNGSLRGREQGGDRGVPVVWQPTPPLKVGGMGDRYVGSAKWFNHNWSTRHAVS